MANDQDAAERTDTDREVAACYCPLGDVMDLLSRRYAMQVVCVVGALGPVRHREIADTLGDVSSSTLSARLDDLAGAGYLVREQYDEIPPRVEYDLTPVGEELCDRLEPLLAWVEEQQANPP